MNLLLETADQAKNQGGHWELVSDVKCQRRQVEARLEGRSG